NSTIIQSLLESQYRTYPTLATSDSVLRQVAKKTGWDLEDLQEFAQARAQTDTPNMLTLTVKGGNAENVANVVDTWAVVFVTTVNDLYGDGNELERYKQQQDVVAQSLVEADKNLTTFRKENGFGFDDDDDDDVVVVVVGGGGGGSSVVGGGSGINRSGLTGQRLQSKNNLLTGYEEELVRLQQMQREVELLSQTASTDSSPALIAGLLAEMINTGFVESPQPYQIKLDSVNAAASLAAMAKALEARITAIETEIEPLRIDIANLQEEWATKQELLEQLVRDRDVSRC
ncbi:hypothetical protein ACFLXQ_01980, partial [Chloroflexota bacterium]